MNLERAPMYANKTLIVDGQDIVVEYCVDDKAISSISIVTPLMTVELSDTCGFCIESEQGTVYLNNNVTNAVSEFAQAEGLTFH
jgi:hypothetical protein